MLSPNELPKEFFTNIVTNWLEWAKPFVRNKVTDILEKVESIATLRHLNQLSIVRLNIGVILYFITHFYILGLPSALDWYIRTNFI